MRRRWRTFSTMSGGVRSRGLYGPRLLVDQALHTPSSRRRTLTSRRRSSGRSFARRRPRRVLQNPCLAPNVPLSFVHDRPPDFLDTYGYTMCPARPEFSDSRYRGHAPGSSQYPRRLPRRTSGRGAWSCALERAAVEQIRRDTRGPEGVAIGRRSGRGPLGGQFDRHAIQANAEITRV